MKTFECKLVTPEKILFQASVWQVSIKNSKNSFAMRANHADLLFTTESGILEIATTETSRQKWDVSDSVLEFSNNECSIISRSARIIGGEKQQAEE
jgi:F0F1-type ATP synthase epsilon subunit